MQAFKRLILDDGLEPQTLPTVILFVSLLVLCLSYIIASQADGFNLPNKDTAQPCIWSSIFALAGVIIPTMLDKPVCITRPRYRKALVIVQGLAPACDFVAFVSLSALHQTHAATISGIYQVGGHRLIYLKQGDSCETIAQA